MKTNLKESALKTLKESKGLRASGGLKKTLISSDRLGKAFIAVMSKRE